MTQTETMPISIDLDTLADQTLAQYHRHQQQDKQRKEHEQARLDQQAIASLQALIATEIGPELLAALNIKYVVQSDRHSRRIEALVHYATVTWHISQDFSHYSSSSWRWHISATRDENGYNYCESNLTHDADPQMLQTILLLHFGQRRVQLRKEEQDATERVQQQLLAEAEAREASERREREHIEQIERASEEDADLRAAMLLLKQQTQEAMWHWPEGVEIPIYHITYTTAYSEDEGLCTESGWTSTDHLGSDGYIRIEAAKTSPWSNADEAREIKLEPEIHRPIWERRFVGSVKALPSALREETSVSIPYVVCFQDPMLDAVSRLRKVERYDYDESAYTESVGYVPLGWVKALVEEAAQRAS